MIAITTHNSKTLGSAEDFAEAGYVPTDDRLCLELHSPEEASMVLREWRALEHRIGDGSLGCSAVWTRTWLAHFGDLVPHRFAVGRTPGGRVCGICLLTQGVAHKAGPFHVKRWHVGTAGEPDADSVCLEWNRLLVEEGRRVEFAQRLFELVSADAAWDEFCLDGFAADDFAEFLASCGGELKAPSPGGGEGWGEPSPLPLSQGERGFQTAAHDFEIRETPSFYFDLKRVREASGDALSALGYATRKNIRKNLKAYGELRTEWAESVAQAESIFADLVRLHQARWSAAGKPGAYASRRFLEFHRDLIPQLVPRGEMGLFRVTCGNEVVGCVQVFVDRNRALCYQGGSAPYTDKLSPGVIVDFLCIEKCLRRGFEAYDFLGGDSQHKQKLSTDCHRVIWAKKRRPRWKFTALDAARRLKGWLKTGGWISNPSVARWTDWKSILRPRVGSEERSA